MRLVYLARPIDQARGSVLDRIAADLSHALGLLPETFVYRPKQAWYGTNLTVDPRVERVNRSAVDECDILIAILPAGVPTIGVPREIEAFAAAGKPWAVLTDMGDSFSLADAGEAFPISNIGVNAAAQWVADIAVVTPTKTGRAQLQISTEVGGGQLPSRSYEGDAGFDLYVATNVSIPAGQHRDVSCGIQVALPDGVWGLITGRSSTIRKRQLLVTNGIIDTGWRGPIFAGVQNVGDTTAFLTRGERIAQLILLPNVSSVFDPTKVSIADFEDIPHDGRGHNGFGSTGT